MPSFEREMESIIRMLEANGYSVRDGMMPLDDFRLFLTPPGFEVESEEVFKLKASDKVHCAAQIIIGGEIRNAYYNQDEELRGKFKGMVKSASGVSELDFFEVADDGKDFSISLRSEFQISNLSEDVFADAMDRLNMAGGSIEDLINSYFDNFIDEEA